MRADDLLTVHDFAKLLGVTDGTIRTYLYRKTIPPPDRRIGRSPVWYRATVERWLASRQGK